MAKILIVDDAFVIREKLRIILKKAGHEVVGEAGNGLQATLMYKRLQPDIVTMDITMPGINGIDGLKRIRSHDENACVVMISAMSQKAMVIEALEAGASGFILKPFNNEKVLTVIEMVEAQYLKGFEDSTDLKNQMKEMREKKAGSDKKLTTMK